MIGLYKKVPQGMAMVRTGYGGVKVEWDKGMFVIPIIQMVEIIDLSIKTIEIDLCKENGLICKDGIRADINCIFFLRVNKNIGDILSVAQKVGCKQATKSETLRNLFEVKFTQAVKALGKNMTFEEISESIYKFKMNILNLIGIDLHGYIIDDLEIGLFEKSNY